jgi:hypothetical protein
MYNNEPPFYINVLPDQWTQVIVPFSAVGNPSAITQISIQDITGGPQPTFYVDNLCLSTTSPPPPPAGCALPIYLEALAPNWQNASWDGTTTSPRPHPRRSTPAASRSARRSPTLMARCR